MPPQFTGQSKPHVEVLHTQLGPGGVPQFPPHWYWQVDGLHTKPAAGGGPPQSAGHSQAHTLGLLLQVAPPVQVPPQVPLHSHVQLKRLQLNPGPGGFPSQLAGHSQRHDVRSH